MQAEFEVEVDGDEVEVELEFRWSLNSGDTGDDTRDDAGETDDED